MKQQEQRSAGTTRRNTFREDEDLEEQINFGDIKRIGAYLKPYLRHGVIILAAVLSMSAIAVAIPYMTKTMIDAVIPSKDPVRLFALGAVFLLAIVIYELLLRYRTVAITQVGQLMLKDMRRDLFTHIQTLPFSYFDSRPHGKILIRVVNYVNTLSDTLSSGLINVIADIFTFSLTLVVMFVIDWRLTLWSLVLMPLLVLYVLILQRFQRRAYQRLSNKQSNLNAYIHESIAGVKTTQTFVREREQFHTFQEQQGQVRSAWMRAVHIQYLMWPGVQNISTITIALIYYLGITGLGGVQVTTGMLIAFVGYANNFWNPIINIGNFYNQLITCSAYLERIFETLDVRPGIEDRPGAIELPPVKGRVDFNDVVFKYEPGGRNILNLVDFHVPAGSTVALVGPTGAGKTTIVNLLSRFYDVTEGSVCVDGHDVRDVTLDSLRRQMGVMLQDTFIFTGNVRENIRYGRLEATDQQVEEAAKAVHAHEFIMELPDGYDTKVEERGSTLSAGQRQLIAFARVLLADPRILILDEATSSIDTRTEEALQAGLAHLLKGRTSFVIAHRLSTIENADQIFYIDHGQIVEHGTHQELLAKRGAYYRLHESQYAMIRTANGDQAQSTQPGDDAGQSGSRVPQDSTVSAQ
ncbi:ABC transporter ATP-binding protein [Bifidobacterium sp. B4081]|uniref:ABC transporter ATP-binding protein n=1 Tax=unclassified Bifidobacterium TaxID=2608897 RepID=UPI0022699992|nr:MULTISPECIES: ABC transporter ATP-binding protein [unclassified Bifidobacterium]MCX8644311.1 ABC transporter ATP-binding protein [Bifidobacterium sp. B4077]MCX8646123.1 ABC transporter ATP-binding protein [Bifidobacterium sp. B4081]MCX8668326.1 ABC transporter ATP-binding protein [Bifidobacterium sp. B3998]MCX8687752.1 ABC transporter ATP-binding protein [Bifidobacterium sp. B4142]